MAKLVSKTYGEALFQLAVEKDMLDSFLDEMVLIKQILKENPEFGSLMNHPQVAKEEKAEVIKNVFEGKASEEIVGFLLIVISKDRYDEIDAIIEYFIEKAKLKKGIGTAVVSSAVELSDLQKQQILDKLLETTPYQQMEISYQINEDLIGGLVIRIGDRVVDSSIKTKLAEMQKDLMKIQLTK